MAAARPGRVRGRPGAAARRAGVPLVRRDRRPAGPGRARGGHPVRASLAGRRGRPASTAARLPRWRHPGRVAATGRAGKVLRRCAAARGAAPRSAAAARGTARYARVARLRRRRPTYPATVAGRHPRLAAPLVGRTDSARAGAGRAARRIGGRRGRELARCPAGPPQPARREPATRRSRAGLAGPRQASETGRRAARYHRWAPSAAALVQPGPGPLGPDRRPRYPRGRDDRPARHPFPAAPRRRRSAGSVPAWERVRPPALRRQPAPLPAPGSGLRRSGQGLGARPPAGRRPAECGPGPGPGPAQRSGA